MEITLALRQRDHCPGSGRSMPCPDVSTAARLAVPRRLRCGSAIIARGWGVACRAPTFPLGRSMPRPDVSTAARQRVLCVRRNAYIYVLWRSSPNRKSAGRSSFPLVLRRQKGHMQMGCRCYCNEHRRRVCLEPEKVLSRGNIPAPFPGTLPVHILWLLQIPLASSGVRAGALDRNLGLKTEASDTPPASGSLTQPVIGAVACACAR